MKKVFLSWSSGKDSAWALHILRQQADLEVTGLFCTINEVFDRVAMHGVRTELLREQADSTGLPIHIIPIPDPCSNPDYERIMNRFLDNLKAQDVEHVAFGDLYLEGVRRYREDKLTPTGITPLFPLWGQETQSLAKGMIAGGLRARITCVDSKQLAPEFSGQVYDDLFLARLPDGVDPCGENGEFHSFAYAGPMFEEEISLNVGETVTRDGFVFTDLLPQ